MLLLAVLAIQAAAGSSVEKTPNAVIVREGGAETVRYQLVKPEGVPLSVESACYFHPLTAPSGTVVTDVAPDDHRHHRGVFFGWVEMRGKKDADFWGWGEKAPKKGRSIVNRGFETIGAASFRLRNEWRAEEEVLLSEDLVVSVETRGAARILDLAYTFTAPEEVRVGRWAFGGFCARARKDGKTAIEGPEGVVDRKTPNHMDPATAWPDARWYACSFELPDGKKAGVAVVNPPSNPKAGWYNATSIAMLNPSVTAPGALTLAAKSPLTLRYRVVAFDGPTPRGLLDDLAKP